MNTTTRRMECNACGKEFDVTPWPGGGAWHIALAEPDAVPFIVASNKPMCVDPRCAHDLTDSNKEAMTTEAGDTIVITNCKRRWLN